MHAHVRVAVHVFDDEDHYDYLIKYLAITISIFTAQHFACPRLAFSWLVFAYFVIFSIILPFDFYVHMHIHILIFARIYIFDKLLTHYPPVRG